MGDYSDAFREVFDACQPDTDPVLTYGDGETPDTEQELDRAIEKSKRAVLWEAGLAVKYGQRVVPTVGNGRKYKVTRAGTLGSSEPSWPQWDYGSVESGTVRLVEDGFFEGSVYDVRAAKYAACQMKADKCSDRVDFSADGANYKESQTAEYWLKKVRKFAPVGIG